MPDVQYTIYRVSTVTEIPSTGEPVPGPIAALVKCGTVGATGPKRALQEWFAGLPLDRKIALDGKAKFVVIPVSNHHELAPKVEAQPRLVY